MTRFNKIAFTLLPVVVIVSILAYGTVHQPIISAFYATVTAMMLLWAADSWAVGEFRFNSSKLQIPLFLLASYALVQIIPFGTIVGDALPGIPRTISVEPFGTQVTAVHLYLLAILFSIALASLDSLWRLRRLTTIFIVFGFAYAFFAILQSVLSPTRIYGIYGPQGAIPFGSFVNKHNFAAVMELLIALPLGLLFTGAVRPDRRLLYIVAVVLMGSSILLSGSRGGLVALIAEVLLLAIISTPAKSFKKKALRVALSILFVGAAIGGAVFVGGDTSLTRFAQSANSTDITSSRTHIWSVTLKVISQNLPFGAGLGAFASAYPQSDTASGLERVEQAHNDYLQIVADAGVVGFAIGALFLFFYLREGLKNIKTKNTLRRGIAVGSFAGCTAVLVHSAFDFVLHITAVSVTFLVVMAMLVASGRKYSDDTDEFEDPKERKRRSGSVTKLSDRKREA